jgi:phage shock protein A
VQELEEEITHLDELIARYKQDIAELEDKLTQARKKHTLLVQRHIHANKKAKAQQDIRKSRSVETVSKFQELESRIDRMEADADLVNYGSKPDLEDDFSRFETDEEIENELEALRKKAEKPQD